MNRVVVVVASAALLVLAIAVVIAAAAAGWSAVGGWFDEFVKSPGFAAIGAVFAAALAYAAASRRIEHDRQAGRAERQAARRAAEAQHWWEVLLWVYDNIDTKDPATMLRICRALAGEARTDGERAMLGAIVEQRLHRDGARAVELPAGPRTAYPDEADGSATPAMSAGTRWGFEALLSELTGDRSPAGPRPSPDATAR